ncbi:MAG: chromosomal replication initiator protein DnaA [Eubacteriales bacterium]|nr:chromosomal replication initiator protein DnaA [Eubacteriales bacterium]MDY3332448.1 chromosomal replication initiator protein DnaA [Gallibacter sp.]
MIDINSKWNKVVELLRELINEVAFESWILPLRIDFVDETHKKINILCNTDFTIESIKNRYLHLIVGCCEQIFGEKYDITLSLVSEKEKLIKKEKELKSTTSTSTTFFDEEKIINPKYTFENFIVGPNSEYAYTAALATAENPSSSFNPLYIYGEPGLGKTHLMYAISNFVLQNHTGKKVLYVSGEMFTNEVIESIRNNKMMEFKEKYRSIDILLIDDVQFFKGKKQTQEELFNTFNTLYDNNKQIVLSSDRHPSKLEIHERLKQRFGWNIVADIQKPLYETRVAILESKLEQEGIEITDEMKSIISIIASYVKNSVRELEGTLLNIVSLSKFTNKTLTTNFVKEYLSANFNDIESDVDIDLIKKIVCKYFDITTKDLISKKRSREIAYPRQIAMYLSRNMTDMSLPKIGKAFGNRDHTTVLHAFEKISKEMKDNESTKNCIKTLEKKISL